MFIPHKIRFHIIHTNDFHSNFINWPQTSSKIKQIKKECQLQGEAFILVDLGDHLDRSHFITEATLGKANVDLLNQLEYDYATIGNNEGITFSKEQLDHIYDHAHFKVILNNLFEANGNQPTWTVPYIIHQIEDIKIAFLAATANYDKFYTMLGWKMLDPIPIITQQVEELREQVDVVVLMSHLGLHIDEKIVEEIGGIDLIIGAHTHHVLESGMYKNQTWITQCGRSGEYVGQVTIDYSPDRPLQLQTNCFNVVQEEKDSSAEQRISYWQEEAKHLLAEEIITLEQDIAYDWYNESASGNILAEGLREWCNTGIAMVNSGQILDHLYAGKVTKKDIHHICPHPINPCVVTLSGTEIWSILERSLDEELQHRHIKGLGFRGKQLGMLSLDGLEVILHEESNRRKISEVWCDGEELQLDQDYKVATIDMFTFTRSLFPELYQPNNATYYLPEFLRDVLEYRLKKGNIERANRKRWKQKP